MGSFEKKIQGIYIADAENQKRIDSDIAYQQYQQSLVDKQEEKQELIRLQGSLNQVVTAINEAKLVIPIDTEKLKELERLKNVVLAKIKDIDPSLLNKSIGGEKTNYIYYLIGAVVLFVIYKKIK